jgi:hypothetical protein
MIYELYLDHILIFQYITIYNFHFIFIITPCFQFIQPISKSGSGQRPDVGSAHTLSDQNGNEALKLRLLASKLRLTF